MSFDIKQEIRKALHGEPPYDREDGLFNRGIILYVQGAMDDDGDRPLKAEIMEVLEAYVEGGEPDYSGLLYAVDDPVSIINHAIDYVRMCNEDVKSEEELKKMFKGCDVHVSFGHARVFVRPNPKEYDYTMDDRVDERAVEYVRKHFDIPFDYRVYACWPVYPVSDYDYEMMDDIEKSCFEKKTEEEVARDLKELEDYDGGNLCVYMKLESTYKLVRVAGINISFDVDAALGKLSYEER